MATKAHIDARIVSSDELAAVAAALEREAAARYRALSARMAQQGDSAMAAQFETLARIEDRHASEVGDRAQALLGHAPRSIQVGWDLPPT